ncbi:MAG TPA: Phenylacetic acid catabolic protein [Ktedonobacterales bacterium]
MSTAEGQRTATEHAAIAALIARIADNKYFLGRRYAEWCSSAPTLESAVAAAAMAQDELGHARAIYPALRTLQPDAAAENEPETRTGFVQLAALAEPFAGWEDFVAANFLIDRALTLLFEAAVSSSFEPLAGRSRKVLQEERMHTMFGEAWARRLAREGGAVRAAFEAALRRDWDELLCWLGPIGDQDALAAAGVLDATPDTLRRRFLDAIGPAIVAEGLALPIRALESGGYELTAPLPWDRWDAATYGLAPEASRAQAKSKSAEKARKGGR